MNSNLPTHPTEPTSSIANDQVLRLFLDSITDQAVFTVDAKGVITTWNEGCRLIKGYTSAEAIGQNFSILYTAADRARGHPDDNLRRALEEGQFHEENDRVRKNGEHFMAEVSIYPVEQQDGARGFAKIVKDISQRTMLQERRLRLEKELRRSNAELEGFSQSVAHDLRTPIRAIVSRCRIMQDDFAPILPTDLLDQLEVLAQRSLKLLRVVDDLLEYSRLGRGTIKRRTVDVSALAHKLAGEAILESHGGAAQIEIQDSMIAEADPDMLELLLRNLLENSCKYSAPGVQIKVAMEEVAGQQVFEVRDDGFGFDMLHAQSLFEPFWRLHGEHQIPGTGLGLANVKRIADRHDGKVWATSEVAKGASIFFTLGGHLAATHLQESLIDLLVQD